MTLTLIVEDGSFVNPGNTNVPGANTYVDLDFFSEYCTNRGIVLSNDPTQLLIRAMDFMETISYIGYKYTAAQMLQWPRADIWVDGWYVPIFTIPWQLQIGQCAVAVAIDEGNGPLIDVPRATMIERVGGVSVQYTPGATPLPFIRNISAQLYKLMDAGGIGQQFKIKKA